MDQKAYQIGERTGPFLALFGHPTVINLEGEAIVFPKHFFVIAAVIIKSSKNGSIEKSRIGSLMWPKLSIASQRTNLRTVIKRIRRIQESNRIYVLSFERASILIETKGIECDLEISERLLTQADPAGLPHLLRFHSDDLLEGSERSSPDVGHWIQVQRAEISSRFVRLACRALEARFFRREPEFELALANKVLALNPTEEEPYRTKFHIHRSSGDRDGLANTFSQLQVSFRRNLDSEPPSDIVAIYEESIRELDTRAARPVVLRSAHDRVTQNRLSPAIALHKNFLPRGELSGIVEVFAGELLAFLWKGRSIRLVTTGPTGSAPVNLVRGHAGQTYDLDVNARASDQARISLTLSHRESSIVIWAEAIDLSLSDVAADARWVASLVTSNLENHQIRLATAGPDSASSPFVMVASADRELVEIDLPSIRKARRLYRAASQTDARNLKALTGLARTYWLEWLVRAGADPTLLTLAQEIGRRALLVGPDSHLSHRELGMIALYARRHDLALEHLSRAVALSHNDPVVSFDFADALISSGQTKEGVALARAVGSSDTQLETFQNWVVATGHYLGGDYQAAIGELSAMKNEEAGFRVRAACHAMLGERQLSETFRRKALAENPTFSVESWSRAIPIRDPHQLRHVVEGFAKAGFK